MEMQIKTSEEVEQTMVEFSEAYLRLLSVKKGVDEEIKDLKSHYTEEGIAVPKVIKAINRQKALQKQSEADKFEDEVILDTIGKNDGIMTSIAVLNN